MTLFDRPLRRDAVLRLWAGVVLVLALVALNGNTTWSGAVEADRVAGFLGDLLWLLLVSFLVLALVPAFVRRAVRQQAAAREQRATAINAADAEADLRAASVEAELETTPLGEGPSFRELRVEGNPAAPGLTTRISWATTATRSVTVDGRSGFPPIGTYEVQLTQARDITLVAHGPDGTTQSRTAKVAFLTLPQLARVSLPAGPGVALSASVSLLSGADAPALHSVDAVLRGHDLTRAALMVPASTTVQGTDLASLARLALDVSWLRRPPAPAAPPRSAPPSPLPSRNETSA